MLKCGGWWAVGGRAATPPEPDPDPDPQPEPEPETQTEPETEPEPGPCRYGVTRAGILRFVKCGRQGRCT